MLNLKYLSQFISPCLHQGVSSGPVLMDGICLWSNLVLRRLLIFLSDDDGVERSSLMTGEEGEERGGIMLSIPASPPSAWRALADRQV